MSTKKTPEKKPKATKPKKNEVAVVQPAPAPAEMSVESLITQAIQAALPVETMERFFALRKEVKAEMAREAFIAAMAKFQAECPVIVKTKVVTTKNGSEAYRYAPIESVVSQVKEALKENGFSYTTNMEMHEDSVKVFVKVQHVMGHSEITEMEVPLGSQTNVMSRSQVVAAASTFAKRYAFLNAFGILTGDEDTDASPASMAADTTSPPAVKPSRSVFEIAKDMIQKQTDPAALNDYWKKIQGSDKYTDEQKEKLEGVIAARVTELEAKGAEKTIEA